MRTIEFRAMGCQMLAAVDHPSTSVAEKLKRVPQWFEGWEQSLSRFRGDSELSWVNQHTGSSVQVSQVFWEVFQASQEAEQYSQGLVTPGVFDAMIAFGYDRSFEPVRQSPAASLQAEIPLPRKDYAQERRARERQALEISSDMDTHTLCLPAGLRLDFGGIAKGWAAQEAVDRLRIYGPALVDAGGDIAISGLLSDGGPWPVGVANPFEPDSNLEVLQLGRCGVATSGRDYHRWIQNGVWRHHIIDPRTGSPAVTDVISATAIAPTLVEAEVAAKVALILGSQTGLSWVEDHPSIAGMVVLEDGRYLHSSRFENYLRSA